MNSVKWLDGSLYPDREVPEKLEKIEDKMDYISRLCSAWDFGIIPLNRTLKEILKKEWKKAIDETRLLTSCAYHLLRDMHGLKSLPYMGPKYPEIINDPYLNEV
jgi:hypothetical protein